MRGTRMRVATAVAFFLAGGACAARAPSSQVTRLPEAATSAVIDSMWVQANRSFRNGKWTRTVGVLERLLLEFAPGDPRRPRAHFFLGECYLSQKNHLQATREFRKVS